ncbi:MAG: Uma2 family endonuclease [Bryobacteraceae bacterium]|nr:Uma2 family endonuclease [Bryobacteraceae bacterium]
MAAAVLVPLAEYLAHSYDPDCEYVDGLVLARNVGEISHSDAQGRTYLYVLTQTSGFWAGVEVRVQVKTDRYRVPDVTIVRGSRPVGRIITAPPEVVVEVLSPDDRAADLQVKIDDYFAFGIGCVWVIHPESGRAWMHTPEGSREAKDGWLRNLAGDLAVPLSAIFPA